MPIPKTNSGEMPFLDHLEELRWRIIYSLGALLICASVGFWLAYRFDAVGLLARPILPRRLQASIQYDFGGRQQPQEAQ